MADRRCGRPLSDARLCCALVLLFLHAVEAQAAACASYCHWEAANCQKDPSACGGCEMCKKLENAPRPALVTTATTHVAAPSTGGPKMCAGWCNPQTFQSHCDNSNCHDCAFCAPEAFKQCGAWCREGNGIYGGQCTDQRCAGCAQCGGGTSCTPVDKNDVGFESCQNFCNAVTARDHCQRCSCKTCSFCPKATTPTAVAVTVAKIAGVITNPSPPPPPPLVLSPPPPPTPPPVIDEKWFCYAQRYPDILQGYCDGVVETCRWASIKKHWKEAGINEGRELACDTDSVRCYVLRYRNLFEGYCGSQLERCAWEKILKHWAFHGYPSNLIIGCEASDTTCYVNRYPDILNGYCMGNVAKCDWEKILEHWAFHGREENRDMGCTPYPPPNAPHAPPPPPPAASPPPPPPGWMDLAARGGVGAGMGLGVGVGAGPGLGAGAGVADPFAMAEGSVLTPAMTLVVLGIVAAAGLVCVGALVLLLRQGGHREHDLIDEPDELEEGEEGEEEYYEGEDQYYDEGEEEVVEERPKKSKKKKSKSKRRSDYD